MPSSDHDAHVGDTDDPSKTPTLNLADELRAIRGGQAAQDDARMVRSLERILAAWVRPEHTLQAWNERGCRELLALAARVQHELEFLGRAAPRAVLEAVGRSADLAFEAFVDEVRGWRRTFERTHGRRSGPLPDADLYMLDAWLDLRDLAMAWLVAFTEAHAPAEHLHGELREALDRRNLGREVAAAHLRTVMFRLEHECRPLRGSECVRAVARLLDAAARSSATRHLRPRNLRMLTQQRDKVAARDDDEAVDAYVVVASYTRSVRILETIARDEERGVRYRREDATSAEGPGGGGSLHAMPCRSPTPWRLERPA